MKNILNKKNLAIAALVALGSAGVVFAADQVTKDQNRSQVLQKAIDSLNLNTTADKLQTAIDSARSEVNKANLKTKLDEAVKASKLTQAQADLALKLFDAEKQVMDAEIASRPTKDQLDKMTLGQIREQRQTAQTNRDKAVAEKLGISVDELTKLRDALRTAGVGPMGKMGMGKGDERGGKGGKGGRGGMGGMMGDRMPSSQSQATSTTTNQ